MADTALNDEEIKEYYDDEEELSNKINLLAQYVLQSSHTTVYTGAGISTSAGIPDFRGPDGVWTLRAKGQAPDKSKAGAWSNARPTLCHMSLVQLLKANKLQCVVSQNCDGLHIKSGIPPEKICELHGNTNVEACAQCGKVYYRGFRVRKTSNSACVTGRRCDDCQTPLRYTTVAFGQSMPDMCITFAEKISRKNNLSICMGTSMRVSPACDLPLMGKEENDDHKLVIINLQKTPADDDCDLRIFAKIDTVMTALMSKLGLDIPNWEDLNLHENDVFLNNFRKQYKFRSAGDTSWFSNKIQLTDQRLQSYLEPKK